MTIEKRCVMLDRLPVELLGNVLHNLGAKDLSAFEQASKECRKRALEHGWGPVAYGPAPFVHAKRPTSSGGWRELAKERRLMERNLDRTAVPDSVALADLYIARNDYPGAAIALQQPPAYPQSWETWAKKTGTVGSALGIPVLVGASAAACRNIKGAHAAVAADDGEQLRRFLSHPAMISAQLVRESLRAAVQGRSKTFAVLAGVLSNLPRLRACLLEAGCDPVRLALAHGNVAMLKIAIAGKFPFLLSHVRQTFEVGAVEGVRAAVATGLLTRANVGALIPASMHLQPARQQECLIELLQVADPALPLGCEPYVPTALNGFAAPRNLNPFLACLMLGEPVLPVLRRMQAGGADPHGVDPVNDFNAWHALATGDVRDFDEVAAYLQELKVNIAHTGGPRRATPLALAMKNSRAVDPAARLRTLIRCGASPRGFHLLTSDGKPMTALQFALSLAEDWHVRVLLEEGAVPTRMSDLTTAIRSKYLAATTLKRLIAAPFRWTPASLDAAFLKVLRGGDRDVEDVLVVLRALSKAGASAEVLAAPHWHGAGARPRRLQGLQVCPGTLSSVGLAIVRAGEGQAMPLVRLFVDELGALPGAAGSHGANAWHALALSPCEDAIEVADFLDERGVSILAAAQGPGAACTPLEAVEHQVFNFALQAKFQAVADQQSSKRRRLDG
jgi:hypothetical protein